MDWEKVEWLNPPELEPGEKHLNCCQQVLMANCDLLGVTEAEAEAMGAYFGGGMRCGGTCGPVNATLMILGKLYGEDPEKIDMGKEFLIEFAKANGSWLCCDIKDEEHVRCEAAIQFAKDYINKLAR